MRNILGVDLAERYSAAVGIASGGSTFFEGVADFGAASKPPRPQKHFPYIEEFARDLASAARDFDADIVVENLSHRMVNPVPAIRAQTVLLFVLCEEGFEPDLVMATQWQRELGYKKVPGVTSKGWAKKTAQELGYHPAKDLAIGKATVDLRDSFLLAKWAQGLRWDAKNACWKQT